MSRGPSPLACERAAGRHPAVIASTLQFPIDFTSYQQVARTDFGEPSNIGVQYDFNDSFCFFFLAGEQLTFVRWLLFDVEAGFGLQLRVP